MIPAHAESELDSSWNARWSFTMRELEMVSPRLKRGRLSTFSHALTQGLSSGIGFSKHSRLRASAATLAELQANARGFA